MKPLAIAVLLALSLPAQAQLYKCVDAKGKTHYTDKPLADCKAGSAATMAPVQPAPPPPPKAGAPAAKTAAAAKPPAKKAAMTPEERERFASDCKVNREQLDWLMGPRGSGVENHETRVGQMKQALRRCP